MRASPHHLARWKRAAAALVLGVAACSGATAEVATPDLPAAAPIITEVTPGEAAAIIDGRLGETGFTLLDVRTPDEFSSGHLAGAENIDFYDPGFADQIASLDRNAEYVVYCRSGNRSSQTVQLMERLGFTNVTDVAGGIVQWQAAGLPVVGG